MVGSAVTTGAATNTTSDIMFIKRLLFLRATLDSEGDLTNLAVPFEDDKNIYQPYQLDHANHAKPPHLPNTELRGGLATAPTGD